MKKKIFSIFLTVVLLTIINSTVAFAADDESITKSGQTNIAVETTKPSSFSARIPKKITLAESNNTGSCNYTIGVTADIGGMEMLNIIPKDQDDTISGINIKMKSFGKADLTATITQSREKFYSEELNTNTETLINCSVTVNNVTAGKWSGDSIYDINITTMVEHDIELSADNYNNIGYVKGETSSLDIRAYLVDNDLYKITSIASDTFKGDTNLTSVTIQDTVTSIGNSAFDGCTGINNLTIPDSVTTIIGESTFNGVAHITYNGTASGCPWGATSFN